MPVHGGVVLDLTALDGIVGVDDTSLVLDVRAGTFGTPLEAELRAEHGVTLGHWPQSIDLSTVGGWLACRSAGQLSTRYGKIEDMVLGLDVVLADGRTLHTGGAPRAAVGPDLTQVFVGSEGTLGVITGARLRVHPAPTGEVRAAFRFPSFTDGLDVCRRILRRGATPAVLRLYDAIEGDRHFGTGDGNMLLVLDEGDPALLDGVLPCRARGVPRRGRRRSRAARHVARTPQRRLRAPHLHRAGRGRRHHGDRGIVVGAPRRVRGGARRAARGPRPGGGVGAPLARVLRRRVPLLHLRRLPAERAA